MDTSIGIFLINLEQSMDVFTVMMNLEYWSLVRQSGDYRSVCFFGLRGEKMSIVLFAMIGAAIKAGIAYWICYGVYCTIAVLKMIINLVENN